MAVPRNSVLSDAGASMLEALRDTGAVQSLAVQTSLREADALAQRIASAPIDVQRCIREGCNGLPAGLPLSCFDPEKISSWGPPIRYKNPLTAIGCALAASVTPEGAARVDAAEARRTEAYFAGQRAVTDEWSRLYAELRAWDARCGAHVAQVIPSKGANVKGWPGLSFATAATPANAACDVVRADMYEWQRRLARFLKMKREAGQLVTPEDQVRWCAQAASCASMAVQALGIYGLNGLLPGVFPISVPVLEGHHYRFTIDGAWNEPSRAGKYDELVGNHPVFEPLFIRIGDRNRWLKPPKAYPLPTVTATPFEFQPLLSTSALDRQVYSFTSWAGWPPTASLEGMACAIAVPNVFPGGARNPLGVHPAKSGGETRASIYARAVAHVTAHPAVANDMMNFAALWIDWLLALPSANEVMAAYLNAWMRSSVEWGPESLPWQDSQAVPLSYADFRAVKDGEIAIAEAHLVGALTGLGQAIGGLVTLNVESIISGLAQYSTAVLTRVASGHPPVVKPIYPPLCRWLADVDYNLDTSSPTTEAMMARVCTALVRYQSLLGVDWGFHLPGTDIPAGPADVPHVPAPPDTSSSASVPWAPILLGAAALGSVALLVKVMK